MDERRCATCGRRLDIEVYRDGLSRMQERTNSRQQDVGTMTLLDGSEVHVQCVPKEVLIGERETLE